MEINLKNYITPIKPMVCEFNDGLPRIVYPGEIFRVNNWVRVPEGVFINAVKLEDVYKFDNPNYLGKISIVYGILDDFKSLENASEDTLDLLYGETYESSI